MGKNEEKMWKKNKTRSGPGPCAAPAACTEPKGAGAAAGRWLLPPPKA